MFTFAVIVILYFYIRAGVWIARKVAGRCNRRSFRCGIRVAIALVFFLVPTGDEIVGRIYFNHLCETEAGAKIYQTIELPSSYWNAQNIPSFYKGASNNDIPLYAFERLGIDVNAEWNERQRWFGIEQFGTITTSEKFGQKLNEVVGFRYFGGWVARNLTSNNLAISCGGGESYDDLVKQQFIPGAKIGGEHGNNQ